MADTQTPTTGTETDNKNPVTPEAGKEGETTTTPTEGGTGSGEYCNCEDKDKVESDSGILTTKKPTYIIPPLGSRGTFEFKKPFDSKLYNTTEYEVKALRSMKEVYDSEEDPFTNIYDANGLTEDEFKTDLDWNVPIVVLTNDANQYFYIPATYIGSMPKITGIKYQEVMMAINLGYLPLDFDTKIASDTIKEDIKTSLGIESTVEILKTSSVEIIPEEKHNEYKKLLAARKTISNSPTIRLKLMQQQYDLMKERLELLHQCIEKHIEEGLKVVPGQI